MNINLNARNLALMGRNTTTRQGLSPENNLRRLNAQGHIENLQDAAVQAGVGGLLGGAGGSIAHCAKDSQEPQEVIDATDLNNIRISHPEQDAHNRAMGQGSVIGGAVAVLGKVARDAYDTIMDTPNTGAYADGGPLSNRNKDGTPKKSS